MRVYNDVKIRQVIITIRLSFQCKPQAFTVLVLALIQSSSVSFLQYQPINQLQIRYFDEWQIPTTPQMLFPVHFMDLFLSSLKFPCSSFSKVGQLQKILENLRSGPQWPWFRLRLWYKAALFRGSPCPAVFSTAARSRPVLSSLHLQFWFTTETPAT